jgi:Phosphotransferase enzyme family
LRFNLIGCICKTPEGGYEIGPIPGLGGPFATAEEYYKAWVKAEEPMLQSKPSINHNFLGNMAKAAGKLSKYSRGPFSLCHPDFGNHNILVDNEYNILSIIDWGTAKVLPFEFSGVFPSELSGVHEIFWKGGPFDNVQRRQREVKRGARQSKYVKYVREDEKAYSLSLAAE